MAKNRYINTKFWSDGFIIKLSPLERYLFLYFLTNEHTDICGIYELPLEIIERETGIEYDSLLKLIDRLKGKIYIIEDWVYIKNFSKHQATNPKVSEGINRSLKEIPPLIKDKIDKINIEYDSLLIDYEQLKPKLKLKLKPKLKLNIIETTNVVNGQSPDENKEINKVIDEFYKINPTINYVNCQNRNASKDLIKKFGLEKLIAMIQWYQSKMSDKYCPIATTPKIFKDKLGDIIAYANKLKNNNIVQDLGEI